MPIITLPNKDQKNYKNPVTSLQIASEISPRLASDAFVAEVNGELWDLNRIIEKDSTVSILTSKNKETLDLIRHDAAHIMAEAVLELFPETQVTIGPSIENGFYYDFYREKKFNLSDLEIIEKRMHEIVDRDEEIIREVWSRKQALDFFKKNNEKFKVELVDAIPDKEIVTFYRQGNFIDLCRGPHAPSTKKLGHSFKLTKLAGSYWRGDSKNTVLQRIYGTAFLNEKDLKNHLLMIEEAEKRDHRKIGKEMNLFHFQEEAPGMVFWHPDGWAIYRILQDFIRKKLEQYDYKEINTPQVVDRKLWEASGHWDKYRENMFITEIDEEHANEKRTNALKPMNCPCHVQVYNQGLKSYRDLPLRYAEFGSCHRYEASGTMHGLMRVRGFTQDDGHIFCTEDQLENETKLFIELLSDIYTELGFESFDIKLSTRPETRVGSDEVWDKAEIALESAIKKLNIPYEVQEGDGAFYGPKLDFVLTDAIGREWQCGTFQADFNLPERLDAEYIGEDGGKHKPVMIHRAVLGSFERFIGVLIENYAGRLPAWLAPTQVVICTIVSEANDYANKINDLLYENGFRSKVDTRNEKISYKIREHSNKKVPNIIILGKKEIETEEITVRKLGTSDNFSFKIDSFIKELQKYSK